MVFSVFAGTVVATRLVGGNLPDQIGAARCAVGAALIEAAGALSARRRPEPPGGDRSGRLAMGAAFSLLFPALSLLAVDRVVPERRGAAMGTFTAASTSGCWSAPQPVGAAAAWAATAPPSTWPAPAALACAALSATFIESAQAIDGGAAQRSR